MTIYNVRRVSTDYEEFQRLLNEAYPTGTFSLSEVKHMEGLLEAALSKYPLGDGADCLRNWVYHGREPGGFVSAALRGDLMETYRRADSVNWALIPSWVQVLDALPVVMKRVDQLRE